MKIQKVAPLCLAALLLLAGPVRSEFIPAYAIVGCRIVPVSMPVIEDGTIIIRDGLIVDLGPKSKIKIPDDAKVVDAVGLTAYPGLIDAHTHLFLDSPQYKPVSMTEMLGGATADKKITGRYPDRMAYDLIKIKKDEIDKNHKLGFTTVLIVPVQTQYVIFAGQSVLLNINGTEIRKMVVRNPVAHHVQFGKARGAYPGTVMGSVTFLRQSFLDANYYHSYKALLSRAGKGLKRPDYDPFLEALEPMCVDKEPVIFHCQNLEDINRALQIIREFELNAMLSGMAETWRKIKEVKTAGFPLFLSLHFSPPYPSKYLTQGKDMKEKAEKEIYPANPAKLYKAGIRFALTTYGLPKRDSFKENVRKAIEAGLPEIEALKALTLYPAQFLGVESQMGSLEPGKIANVVLSEGYIFGEKSRIKKVFVDGILFDIPEPPKAEKTPKKDKDSVRRP